MKLKNNVKGITLIALVVTIIVLLILAGVALNLTIGQNGIFSRAQDAANTWRNAESNEQLAMGELEDWINSVSGESNDEKEPTYTNIFAQLYDNGDGSETLVFTSDDSYRENGLTYKQSYDITDEHFIMGEGSMPPWLDASTGYMNSTIKTVKIVDEIKPENTSSMFAMLTSLENIEGMENLNTENVEDMSGMFYDCKSISSLDLSSFKTSNVTNMSGMFVLCENITDINLSSFDTGNVTGMSSMFENCVSLKELDISNFNTSNVTDMSRMFSGCLTLSTIYVGTNWTTATNADGMFYSCIAQEVTPKS